MQHNLLDDGEVIELAPHLGVIKLRVFTKLLPGTHFYLTKPDGIQAPEATQNRTHLLQKLKCDMSQLVILNQVHSPRAIYVQKSYKVGAEPEADAMVTDKKNVVLAILTADCAPVLLYDRAKQIIGAAHAGWKGALSGVIQNTITEMKNLGATNISAVLGPMIRQESYEVGPEFFEKFIAQDPLNKKFFKNKPDGKFLFDLPRFVRQQLEDSHVTDILDPKFHSFANRNLFFSYRRTSTFGDTHYGNIVSTISLQ